MQNAADIVAAPRLMSPWPLELAEWLQVPSLSVSLGVGILTLTCLVASGAWFPEDYSPLWSSSRQLTGMALTYVLLLSYLSGFFIYTSSKTLAYVEELRPSFVGAEADALTAQLNRLRPSRYYLATGAGVVLGSFNIDWRALRGIGSLPHWPIDLCVTLGSMLVWIFVAQIIYSRAHNAVLLSRLGREHVVVDLYRIDSLKPFARIGILDVLLTMGALAITPLQALDAEFRLFNYSFGFSVGLPAALFLLISPMWGVHRRLRDEKARELAELGSSISAARRGHDRDAIMHLNALLERCAYVQALHPWPMDLRSAFRVGFYLVIPPLAWIGAALVEMAVQAFVSSSAQLS